MYPRNMSSRATPSSRLTTKPLSILKKLTTREGRITNRPTASAAARTTATVMAMSEADLPSFSESHFSNFEGSSSMSSPSSSALRVVIFMPPVRASTKA